jgi:HAD superfamily hydrolase (TIGR01549 family)
MAYRAALLDLDDTTLDRDETVSRFIDRFITHYASAIDPGFLPKLKPLFIEIDDRGNKPRAEMFAELHERFVWTAKPNIQLIQDYWYAELPECARPMPGLYDTLAFLREKGMKIGIVTNGSSRMQNAKIDRLEMRALVDAVVISEEAGFRKPDARIFELALSKIGARSAEAFFVGDSPTADIAGALNAGLTAVWMSGGGAWTIEEFHPDYTVNNLLEIKKLIC